MNEHSGVTWRLCFPWRGKSYSNMNPRVNPLTHVFSGLSRTSPGLPETSRPLSNPALAVCWAPWIPPNPADSRHSPGPTWHEEAGSRAHGLRAAHFSLPVPIFGVMLQAFLTWPGQPSASLQLAVCPAQECCSLPSPPWTRHRFNRHLLSPY